MLGALRTVHFATDLEIVRVLPKMLAAVVVLGDGDSGSDVRIREILEISNAADNHKRRVAAVQTMGKWYERPSNCEIEHVPQAIRH